MMIYLLENNWGKKEESRPAPKILLSNAEFYADIANYPEPHGKAQAF
jgi:hypothetical protein